MSAASGVELVAVEGLREQPARRVRAVWGRGTQRRVEGGRPGEGELRAEGPLERRGGAECETAIASLADEEGQAGAEEQEQEDGVGRRGG